MWQIANLSLLIKGLFLQNVEALSSTYDNIVGNVLLSAGMVAYMGPFIMDYRQVCQICVQKLFCLRKRHIGGLDSME